MIFHRLATRLSYPKDHYAPNRQRPYSTWRTQHECRLGDEDAGAAHLLDLLLREFANETRLHDHRLLGQLTLAQQLLAWRWEGGQEERGGM